MQGFLCADDLYMWLQSETIDLTAIRQRGDGIISMFGKAGESTGKFKEQADSKEKFIDRDGLPFIGQVFLTFRCTEVVIL